MYKNGRGEKKKKSQGDKRFYFYFSFRVINHPKHKSICYHPSILPRHRGASAINWTLIEGDRKGGFSIFWADDGLDTGPLLLQKECYIGENDTVDSIYNRYVVLRKTRKYQRYYNIQKRKIEKKKKEKKETFGLGVRSSL